MSDEDEVVPTGDGFEEWALQEFVHIAAVIRALEERLAEALQVADERLDAVIGVRESLAGGKAIKLVNRNQFGEITSVEEFTPAPAEVRQRLTATSTGSKG